MARVQNSRSRLSRLVGASALVFGAATVLGLSMGACGGGSVPKIDCTTATVKKYSELTIWEKCTNCHSKDRTGDKRHLATEGYDYNTPELAKATALDAQDDVAGAGKNDMPPTDQTIDDGTLAPQPTEAEKTDLYTWVQCGEPI